jgi:bla regulator protein blaR1
VSNLPAIFVASIALCASAQDRRPAYEAASIKPNVSGSNSSSTHGSRGQIVMVNTTLKRLIERAYDVRPFQVTGPDWMESVHFDVSAKYPPETKPAQRNLMLQTLLEDRFHLQAHRITKEIPGYAMVLGKGGLKVTPVKATGDDSTNTNGNGGQMALTATSISMPRLAQVLSYSLNSTVVDKTGVEGVFNIELKYSTNDAAAAHPDAPASIFTALAEKLGLHLQAQKVPVQFIVVDRVERMPTEN